MNVLTFDTLPRFEIEDSSIGVRRGVRKVKEGISPPPRHYCRSVGGNY